MRLQGIAITDEQNKLNINKWANQLSEHYLKIADMVPQWNKKLDQALIKNLNQNISEQRYQEVLYSLDNLQKNCAACHQDYQAVTALIYRSADFSSIKTSAELSFGSQMKSLTKQLNQIKIASEDGMTSLALNSLARLSDNMSQLGESCVDCHKKDKRTYPNIQMNQTLASLEQSLKTGTLKQQGRDIGTLAVLACARCHGTHRIAFGAKKLLSAEPSLADLLKH